MPVWRKDDCNQMLPPVFFSAFTSRLFKLHLKTSFFFYFIVKFPQKIGANHKGFVITCNNLLKLACHDQSKRNTG
jgi:hypothetical protein